MELNVHERQRLLHVLDMCGSVVGVLLAGAKIGQQLCDIAARTEASTQQAAGMQTLQPLGIVDVAFSTWDGPRFAGVGQDDFEPVRLEHFKGGDPVDACRFHHDRFRSGCNQPIGHAFQITGKSLKRLDWFVAQIRADGGDVESCTDIDAGREWMNDRQPAGLGS